MSSTILPAAVLQTLPTSGLAGPITAITQCVVWETSSVVETFEQIRKPLGLDRGRGYYFACKSRLISRHQH